MDILFVDIHALINSYLACSVVLWKFASSCHFRVRLEIVENWSEKSTCVAGDTRGDATLFTTVTVCPTIQRVQTVQVDA